MNNKRSILLVILVLLLLFVNSIVMSEEINIKQDINKLDKNNNGKIISIEKVTFSKKFFKNNDIKEPTYLKNLNIYEIKYLSDGLEVVGHLIKPKIENTYPTIIYCRGGNRDRGKITKNSLLFLSRLASKGYIIITTQYRGNDGGKGIEEFGGQDVNDVLNLVPLIKSLDFIIPNKIFMLGASRGGMMSYIAIKKGIDVNAATILSGITNLMETYNNRPGVRSAMKTLIGCTLEECKDKYKRRSAYYWADEIDIPVLILHGEYDFRVDISQAKQIAKKLKKYDKRYKLVTYDDGHGLKLHYKEWTKEMFAWFEKYN